MIYKHRLEKLSEEELSILLYCLNHPNQDENNLKYRYEYLHFLKPNFVNESLKKMGTNLSIDKKQFLQNISEKLFTSK
jgi:hypothetical protein